MDVRRAQIEIERAALDVASGVIAGVMLVRVTLIVPGVNVIGLAIGATSATLRMLDAERMQRAAV